MSRPTIQLTGDALDGRFVTWEVYGRPGSIRCAQRSPARIAAAVARLEQALPDRSPSAETWRRLPPLPDSPTVAASDEQIRRLHATMAGPLRDPEAEQALMTELGDALLPQEFRADLERLRTRDELPLLRLAPSPGEAGVPWALLHVGRGRRLIELCDIAWIAPLVDRDSRGQAPVSWSEVRHLPCLHVIDPAHTGEGKVLDGLPARDWVDHAARHPGCSCHAPVSRIQLSRDLQSARSRLFFVGHVVSAGPSKATLSPGLLLSPAGQGEQKVYTTNQTAPDNPPLTDVDLVRGVPALDQRGGRLVPPLAEHQEQAVRGPALWPMPPRVALIACRSGPDLAKAEATGLVTAMTLLGAELVTATLWTLPTDRAYREYAALPRFSELIRAADTIQQTHDPIRELAIWQRERLDAWRTTRHPDESPLWWAGLVHFHAPDRRVSVPEHSTR